MDRWKTSLTSPRKIEGNRDEFHGLASRHLMASLFSGAEHQGQEAPLRAAMKRLGGDTVTVADPKSSSMEKGESLADTIRVWSGYSDLIVLRHPWEGASRLAAQYSDVSGHQRRGTAATSTLPRPCWTFTPCEKSWVLLRAAKSSSAATC